MTRLSRRGVLQSTGALLIGSALGSSGSAQAQTQTQAPTPTQTGVMARLNYNESPFGPSRRAREALLGLGDSAWKYSYEEVPLLRSAIAQHEGLRPENVFVSEGSGEILKLAALIFGAPGRQVIAAQPTYLMLPQYASQRGAAVEWVDVDERFGHDLPAMQAQLTDATSLVYVCNPNNPTGALADPDELRAFIKAVSPRAVVLVDEAYIEYASRPEQATMVDMVRAGANILVTRTFSKLYGLAGLRIGYGIAPAELIRRLEAVRISIPNQAGVAAARASLGDAAFRAQIRQQVGESVAFCTRLFEELKVRYAPTQANFMMFDSGAPGTDFVGFARERGVRVAPVHEPLSTWVRVTMGRIEDLQVFARVLRAFIESA